MEAARQQQLEDDQNRLRAQYEQQYKVKLNPKNKNFGKKMRNIKLGG